MSQDSTAERLERIERLLEDLREDNLEQPVVVEGEKDEAALRALGLEGELLRAKGADTVFAVCEQVGRRHRKAIILTDWDRAGGHLARLLVDGLEANGVRADITYRRALARATKKELVHVEGLANYVEKLRHAARKHPGRRPNA